MCASTSLDQPAAWNNVRLSFALAVFTLAACKKPDIASLETYRVQMCDCINVACANDVYDRWGKALKKFTDVDDDAEKPFLKISRGVNDCRDKLLMDAALPRPLSK